MSLESTPQASVEAQFKVLDQIDNTDVHALIESTLSDWNGREVSTLDITSAIEKVSSLVQENMGSVTSSQEHDIKAALASLKATGEQVLRIGTAAAASLGMGVPKTVENLLGQIDGNKLEEHPAYRKGWDYSIADNVLKLPSLPAGSYVLIGSKDNLSMMIKREDNSVEYYNLEENDGSPGYTVRVVQEEQYHSCGGGSCSGLESSMDSPLVESGPPEPPEVLKTLASPLPAVKPAVVDLLKLKEQLRGINFSRWATDWSDLSAQAKEKAAPAHRPQQADAALCKKSAVDVINCPEHTRKKLEREGKPVFFHCNTVKSGAHLFDCHQLPTDYSRDDLWLSLWNDAGEGGGKATIMKLSTDGCPSRNDLPTIRPYWPGTPAEKGKFIERCAQAETKLKLEAAGEGPKTKGYRLSVQQRDLAIASAQEEFEALEKEVAALQEPESGASAEASAKAEDGASASTGSEQVDQASVIADKQSRMKQLSEFIVKLKEERQELQEQLVVFQQAAKEHLAYVQEQKEIAESGGGGDFAGKLTTIDDITVELTEEKGLEGFPGAIVRTFKLTKEGIAAHRTVTQIDYPDWADFSASGAGTLANLRDVYQKEHGDNPTPMKIHCRAGVGRTGTFVAFSGAMDIIENAAAEGKVSELNAKKMLFNIMIENRSQRDFQMVQQNAQGEQLVMALQDEIVKLARQEAMKV